jgi:hypothetical protein
MEQSLIDNWFSYHPADTDEKAEMHQQVRKIIHDAASELNTIVSDVNVAEKRVMMRKLREAMHWANSAVAIDPPRWPNGV